VTLPVAGPHGRVAWSTASGVRVAGVDEVIAEPLSSLRFSEDGRRLAGVADGSVVVVDLDDRVVHHTGLLARGRLLSHGGAFANEAGVWDGIATLSEGLRTPDLRVVARREDGHVMSDQFVRPRRVLGPDDRWRRCLGVDAAGEQLYAAEADGTDTLALVRHDLTFPDRATMWLGDVDLVDVRWVDGSVGLVVTDGSRRELIPLVERAADVLAAREEPVFDLQLAHGGCLVTIVDDGGGETAWWGEGTSWEAVWRGRPRLAVRDRLLRDGDRCHRVVGPESPRGRLLYLPDPWRQRSQRLDDTTRALVEAGFEVVLPEHDGMVGRGRRCWERAEGQWPYVARRQLEPAADGCDALVGTGFGGDLALLVGARVPVPVAVVDPLVDWVSWVEARPEDARAQQLGSVSSASERRRLERGAPSLGDATVLPHPSALVGWLSRR
jgi:hypothetical protein